MYLSRGWVIQRLEMGNLSASIQSICVAFVGPTLSRNFQISPNPFEILAPELEARGIRCLLTSAVTNRYGRFLDIFHTLIRYRSKIDVICIGVYTGLSFVAEDMASMVGKILGKPVIMRLEGGAIPEFMLRFPNWSRRVLKRANLIISPSNYLIEAIERHGFSARLLPNPIIISEYHFRHRVSIYPTIIWLRALHKVYNPTDAIKALALVSKDYPETQLILVGPDKGDGSLQEIQDLAARLGVSHHLEIIGAIPKKQISNWLEKGDIFLNTTSYESFGISVMEAAACGLCIITTSVGELAYLWKDGFNALLVPPHDPEAIAIAFRRIMTEPELAGMLSQNARNNAILYDMDLIADQWKQVLLNVYEEKIARNM